MEEFYWLILLQWLILTLFKVCPYLSPVRPALRGTWIWLVVFVLTLLIRILSEIFLCSSDSDSAPLLERCEGHPAGGPLPGELLLSGGGAPQQAGGWGPVGLYLLSLSLPPVFFLPSSFLWVLCSCHTSMGLCCLVWGGMMTQAWARLWMCLKKKSFFFLFQEQ